MSTLRLRNPHSVLAAIETRPEDVSQILLPSMHAQGGDGWDRVLTLAREKKIPIRTGGGGITTQKSDRNSPKNREEHAGRAHSVEAVVKEREPVAVEELFAGARDSQQGLWLALDCLQDPQNVGAIFRAAAFFGVKGILLTQERSAPLTSTVYDVATGGLEYVPFTIQPNLQRAFEVAKDSGLWILGTSEHHGDELSKIERDRNWLGVLGNEEKGMRRLTEETCDVLCRIAPVGKVTSLNVSVAAGIFISRLA